MPPRGLSGPPRGIGFFTFIVQMFALLGVTLLWMLILIPNVFVPMGSGPLVTYGSLVAVWIFVYLSVLILTRSARRTITQGMGGIFLLVNQDPFSQLLITLQSNWLLVVVSILVLIVAAYFTVLLYRALPQGFKNALNKKYEWDLS